MKIMLLLRYHTPLFLFYTVYGCGTTTHIEISHRAKTYFKDNSGAKIDYAELIRNHNDALMAGSPYPDAFYDNICAKGQYHNVSEDTHWAPFLNASVNYINAKYPQPWDEATEKLVVFMFGVVSHQVADILWHSLGIDQGFLQAMANMNFHGKYDDAHSVGDIGGDILTEYEMNTSYIPLVEGWYIPTEDLYNIYNNFNGTKVKLPKEVIAMCSVELYFERLAEALGAKELFPDYAAKSPFMVDQFENYFMGGVDDMAGWTNRIWQQTVTMIEKGTGDCEIQRSTLYLHCNESLPKLTGYRDPGKNGYFRRPPMNGVSRDDVIVEKTLRGIRIKPSKSYMAKLLKKVEMSSTESTLKFESNRKALKREPRFPDRLLFLKNDYARLGESYATGDLNFDGKPDLVVTAPGYGTAGSPQEGRVYIIYGDENGIPKSLNPDLDTLETTGHGQILKGLEMAQSRFGTSVAVMDINLDGADDIAIGAPAMTELLESPLYYNGTVLIYFGLPKKKIVASGAANITITCKKVTFCNLGFSMSSGDVNNDGFPDLVIGTPFAQRSSDKSSSHQAGFVTALFADANNLGPQFKDVGELTWAISGNQSYGWFGHSISFGRRNNQSVLFVSQPEFRYCSKEKSLKNCSYNDESATMSVGRVHAYYGTNFTQKWTGYGNNEWSQTGWSVDIGSPYPDKKELVIAVGQPGYFVHGTIGGKRYDFGQTGSVGLINITYGWPPNSKRLSMNHLIQGDRSYERFGAKVKFWDVTNDGLSDLCIGAPFRSEDITEELYDPEQGQVYIYTGGENFPFKVGCGNSLVHPCPTVQADFVLQWPGKKEKTRFGTNFAFLNSTYKRQLFVTAQHASDYARLGGAIGIFDF